MQIPRLKVQDHIKITVFVSWAAFGVIPTIHWYFEMGGNENSMVNVRLYLLFPMIHKLDVMIILDFYSPRHWNVRTGYHRISNLHPQSARTLDGGQSRFWRSQPQLVAHFRACRSLLLAQ